MKNILNKFLLILFLVIVPVIVSIAQGPPPPPLGNPGTPTSMESTSGPLGSIVPISDGIYFLLLFALFYGSYKFFQAKKLIKP